MLCRRPDAGPQKRGKHSACRRVRETGTTRGTGTRHRTCKAVTPARTVVPTNRSNEEDAPMANPTATRPGVTFGTGTGMNPAMSRTPVGAAQSTDDEAQKHSEGPVARGIEHYTAQMPSDWFLWAAGGSIVASLTLQ